MDISIIIPIFNGENWIDKCMESIANQTILQTDTTVEIVIHNDGSTDRTKQLIAQWEKHFSNSKINCIVSESPLSFGVGAAKNQAVKKCNGQYLCFQDVDDIMFPNRILKQFNVAKYNQDALVGSKIIRHPPSATPRFVRWVNNLTAKQLLLQTYTSNGPTIVMPSWFCHRKVYDKVGGFVETGYGIPEDLLFFNKHLDHGGKVIRVDDVLVIYTYHENAATFSIARESIWKIQLERMEKQVLFNWMEFTIWNAGKAGRRLVRALSAENIMKLKAFCDVDINKIGKEVELYCPVKRKVIAKVPVIHFTEAKPPLIICVKLDLTNGQFESNLKSLNLREGIDYIYFC